MNYTKSWNLIAGLYCAGGPADGCLFALEGRTFGAPGLVLVNFGGPARCQPLLDRAGFVSLDVTCGASNSGEIARGSMPPAGSISATDP